VALEHLRLVYSRIMGGCFGRPARSVRWWRRFKTIGAGQEDAGPRAGQAGVPHGLKMARPQQLFIKINIF